MGVWVWQIPTSDDDPLAANAAPFNAPGLIPVPASTLLGDARDLAPDAEAEEEEERS